MASRPKVEWMGLRPATPADHADIMKIAKQTPYTRDFSNHMFSNPVAYQREWIWVAHRRLGCTDVIGFFCVRHKVRSPATSLYFIGVDQQFRRGGVATALLKKLIELSPSGCVQLNCMKDNEPALRFYARHGFRIVGESLAGKGHALEFTKEAAKLS